MTMKGTVLKGIGGFYYVLGQDGAAYTLHAQSKLRSKRLKPMVGDKVEFEPGIQNEEDGWLKCILPRKNELVRPPISNIDCIVITLAASVPQADLLLTDRMLIAARQKSITPMLAVNKCDADEAEADAILGQYDQSGIQLFKLSAYDHKGTEELKHALYGKIHAFAGQSGVGKSSLINAL